MSNETRIIIDGYVRNGYKVEYDIYHFHEGTAFVREPEKVLVLTLKEFREYHAKTKRIKRNLPQWF
jgi:hypothetical protein